jgi:hypothetical protein
MRVCAGHSGGAGLEAQDAEGNLCNWTSCGYDDPAVNEYFGGCEGNPTAGTLCCP